VLNARKKFRKSKGIDEQTTVLFYNPGNTAEEVSSPLKLFEKELKSFSLNIQPLQV